MSARVKRSVQRGFTIVSAIFILVVLAGLGAAMLTVSTTQHIGSALDVQGSQAYQAARAGIEWGLYQRLRLGAACATNSFTLPAASTSLTGFTVTVTCTSFADGSNGPTVYEIESTACNQPVAGWTAGTVACPGAAPGANYVERRLKVTL